MLINDREETPKRKSIALHKNTLISIHKHSSQLCLRTLGNHNNLLIFMNEQVRPDWTPGLKEFANFVTFSQTRGKQDLYRIL